MSLDIDLSRGVFEDTDSGFSTKKRHFRKRATGNGYTITAGSTLTMASNRRINTGQPWLPFEFYNGVLSRSFESTNVSGYADSENVATPTPTLHSVSVDDATQGGPSNAFDITAGRIYGMDGSEITFDSDDQHLHELQTHSGTQSIAQRNWHATTTLATTNQTFTLATAHANATLIYGRCKITWNYTGSVPLPQAKWYDIGGDIVVEHLCFQDLGGNYATYPSAMYKLTFRLTGGVIYLDANSVLCNDYLVNDPHGWTAMTIDWVIHSAAFS